MTDLEQLEQVNIGEEVVITSKKKRCCHNNKYGSRALIAPHEDGVDHV